MSDIVIIDYTLGNLFNIQRAFEFIGVNTLITDKAEDIKSAKKIILPGVGAFGEGMKHLKEKGLDKLVKDTAAEGKPVLGICLGMQLLMSESEEHGQWEGLDLISGKVVYFDPPRNDERFKIPHMGWNGLIPSDCQKDKRNDYWAGTILDGLKESTNMYFVHSFYVQVEDPGNSIAFTNYGHNRFSSVVQKNNIIGCQFHPERSGEEGLSILKNFVSMK